MSGDRPGGPAHGWVSRAAVIVCGPRSKYLVLAFWLIVAVFAVPLAGRLSSVEKNDPSAYLPASAQSTQVLALQTEFVPPNLNPTVVLYVRQSGLTAADKRKIASDAGAFGRLGPVQGRVIGPTVSGDGEAAQIVLGSSLGFSSDIGGFVSGVRSRAASGDPGLRAYVTGPAATAADQLEIFDSIDSTLLYATVGVVIVLLLLTYRSPVLWLLPLLSAGTSLAAAQAAIYLIASRTGLVVNGQSAGILIVLVLGAATDYALLLVARYREELRREGDRHLAMAVALRRAGPAIVASGATVIAGMVCLLLADSANISGLGPVAAIGVTIGLAAMLTLLPALLVTAGRWIFWPQRPHFGSPEPTESGPWARMGAAISRRPRTVWLGTSAALVIAALGLAGFRFGTLTSAEQFRGTPASVTGERALARHFEPGTGEPVTVIGSSTAAAPMRSAVAGTRGIAAVTKPRTTAGLAFMQATLTSKPDSAAAAATVKRVRANVATVPGANAKVGGATAINVDIARYAARDRDLIIPTVLVVVLIILGVLLRALVAPLILIATVVLSFAAALGLSALAFRHLFGFAAADTSTPLFVFVFLVALGIDYNIFLMTRVREETGRASGDHPEPAPGRGRSRHRGLSSPTQRGALTGLAATGGVITSAGLVLAGTFATLATLPLVVLTEIGFAVALGVLLDTLVVRSILVTALTLDVDRWMWWPSRLAREVPPGLPRIPGAGPDRTPT